MVRYLRDLTAPRKELTGQLIKYVPANWLTSGAIEFQDVTIRHHLDGPDILKNINLKFQAGERIALVGQTGSGKSTVSICIPSWTPLRGAV